MRYFLSKAICYLIMFLCKIEYAYLKNDIYYIKGTGKDLGKYLLYTEKENIALRMDNF